jgi:hypothetical protein
LGTRKVVLFAIGAVVAGLVTAVPAAAGNTGTRAISTSGTGTIAGGLGTGTADIQNPELFAGMADAGAANTTPVNAPAAPNRSQGSGKSAEGNGTGDESRNGSNSNLLVSFDGLNHNAQRFANGGNQFSLEPPDQGLCAGGGMVMETINDVTRVYSSAGAPLTPVVDLNTFLGYPAAINRSTGARGQFVTDPSCLYDSATQRWFMDALTLETFPSNGRFTGVNHLDIAVSVTSSPLGAWNIYRLPVQDDGTQGTPDHGCTTGPYPVKPTNPNACFGDYPHIGADAFGFYITTNEYSFFGPEFKAAQIYAFSKQAFARGDSTILVNQIDTANMVRGKQAGFTVWPASAPNGHFATSGDGTEYFLSSNAADEVNVLQNRMSRDLVVWTLSNTESLGSSSPSISISNRVLRVGLYAAPPTAHQKAGPTPLADCLNDTSLPVTATLSGCWRLATSVEPAHNQVENQAIDTNDTRMQQVTFAGGLIYGALDTAVKVKGQTLAGIEWFAVRPGGEESGARVSKQGYVGAAGANLSYPALGVNEDGVGAMAFTLVGPNDYPTAAYAPFSARGGVGKIHVAAVGLGPDDGFTAYGPAFGNPPRTRWGDYGAAVVDGSNLWLASEYIGQTCTFDAFIHGSAGVGRCGNTRSALGNWDTRITSLSLGEHSGD